MEDGKKLRRYWKLPVVRGAIRRDWSSELQAFTRHILRKERPGLRKVALLTCCLKTLYSGPIISSISRLTVSCCGI